VPLGVAAGVYLEEYAPKNWMTDIIEINVTNLAGVPSIIYGLLALGLFVYTFGFGQSILTRRPDAGAADPADRHRGDARGDPRHSADDPRGRLRLRRHDLAGGARPHRALFQRRHPDRRDHRHGARHRRDGADHHHRRADLHRLPAAAPITGDPPPGVSFRLAVRPFTVMPIQMFNWTSRPEAAFQDNAAAAGFILVVMTLAMNGLAIWLRYRLRKNIKW
jgi:phosphate transport system permease protein